MKVVRSKLKYHVTPLCLKLQAPCLTVESRAYAIKCQIFSSKTQLIHAIEFNSQMTSDLVRNSFARNWHDFRHARCLLQYEPNIFSYQTIKNVYSCPLKELYRCFPYIDRYHKVASSNMSCLEAHAVFFSLLMKGIFDPYVLVTF